MAGLVPAIHAFFILLCTQNVDAQNVDAQDVDAQDVDAQNVDAQDVDARHKAGHDGGERGAQRLWISANPRCASDS
jgi:hypothetical protein